MITEHTRNEVWHNMLEAARVSRYYHTLSERHQRKHHWTRFTLFAAAFVSMIVALGLPVPAFLSLPANAAIFLAVVWEFMQDYPRKAAVLSAIRDECGALEIEWQSLWAAQDVLDDHDIRTQNKQLLDQLHTVTTRSGHVGVREDAALNQQAAAEAYQVMEQRYAT